jgi:predicted ATP-grasp superfamily ATP-dependent carboligase
MMSISSLRSAILVHELVTGGGWPGPDLPPVLKAEALAILQALLHDLRDWARFPLVTTRDVRLPETTLPADLVVGLDAADYRSRLLEVARQCGSVLLVAPEGAAAHARVSADLAAAGVSLLGSTPGGIAAAADKWLCHRLLLAEGIPVPHTECVGVAEIAVTAKVLGYPVVVKPLMGTGCEGVCFIPDAEHLAEALEDTTLRTQRRVLVQRYVDGTPASVALLVSGGRSVPLGLSHQRVRLGAPCEYLGGVACPGSPTDEAFRVARGAVAAVPGLRGFVGVDMVLTDAGCSVVEINPRVTTSYLGLRRALPINLAEWIWRACSQGRLPCSPSPSGSVTFSKDGTVDD